MSTLEDIIRGATTDDVSVPSLLRMMKVLGARTETAVLVDWVDNELGGYPDGDAPSVPWSFCYAGVERLVRSTWVGVQERTVSTDGAPRGLPRGGFRCELP